MMKQSNRNRPTGWHTRFNNNRHSNNYMVTRNTAFDSSSPAGRIHGNSQQLIDKYLSLAKDARNQDDRVMYETYLQYADHYTRLLDMAMQNEQMRQASNVQVPIVQPSEEATVSDEVKEQAKQVVMQVSETLDSISNNQNEVVKDETKQTRSKNNHFHRNRAQKTNSKTKESVGVSSVDVQNVQSVPVLDVQASQEIVQETVPQPVVIEIPD